MTRSEVASAAGVAGPAVSNWVRRLPDFPVAMRDGKRVGYPVAAVARWLDGRVIPRDALWRDEYHGRTYGDRFRAAVGLPAVARDVMVSGHGGQAVELLDQRVWAPLEGVLRASGVEPTHVEAVVLSLVCLRSVDPACWAIVRRAPEQKIREALARVPAHLSGRLGEATKVLRDTGLGDTRLRRIVDVLAADRTGDADLFEFLLDRFARHRHRSPDEYLVPADVAELMVGMLDPRPRDSVLDPCCGAGTLLITAAYVRSKMIGPAVALHSIGRAATARTWSLATMNAAAHGLAIDLGKIPKGDPRRIDAPKGRFDVVLLNAPFGMKSWSPPKGRQPDDWRYGQPSDHNAAFAWLQTAVEALAPGGRAAVIMPYSATSARTSREYNIRTRMVEDGVVRCVVALPSHLFRETTSPVTMWILGHPGEAKGREVLLVDARSAFDRDGKTHRVLAEGGCQAILDTYRGWSHGAAQLPIIGDHWSATTASLEEIEKQQYDLQPVAYLDQRRRGAPGTRSQPVEPMLPADGTQPPAGPATPLSGTKITLIGAVPAHWQEVRLDKCCDVQPGPSGSLLTSDDYAPGGDVPVISPRDIGINGINPSPAINVSRATANRLNSRYRIRPGDILLVRVGATTRFAMVTEMQWDWLIASSCIRIRPDEDPDRRVTPEYLSCYLGHYAVQEWLADLTDRGVIPTLSKKLVGGLPVVLPPAAVQKDLAAAAKAIDEGIAVHLNAIRAARAQREQLLPGLLSGT